MSDRLLDRIQELIQHDVGNRGLRTDLQANLITACPCDFHAACRSLADTPDAVVAVVTGFFIPHAEPPSGETDGPLGAVFLARTLVPLGIRVVLVTDAFCTRALQVGLTACGLARSVPIISLPAGGSVSLELVAGSGSLTHLIALERVGPSHTPESLRAQPASTDETVTRFLREVRAEHHDRCHSLMGRDITTSMSPAHRLWEDAARQRPRITTIGIGDGGNEIGMGKIPWEIIRRNIPRGAQVACRVTADHLIVCGVSNWGAYGLAAGVRLLRGQPPQRDLFDPERERELLRLMVEHGPLVDGVTGQPTLSVDGLPFDRYAEPLRQMAEIEGERSTVAP
jgi:hypothetical protein